MDVTTEKLNVSQIEKFIELIHLFEEVFETEPRPVPNASHLKCLLEDIHFVVIVASVSGVIVAGLTAYVLEQYISERPLLYIYDLAVAKGYQRKGIGKQLIAEIKTYGTMMRAEEIFVQADEGDLNALEFYRATHGTSEKVIHFYYSLVV